MIFEICYILSFHGIIAMLLFFRDQRAQEICPTVQNTMTTASTKHGTGNTLSTKYKSISRYNRTLSSLL